MSNWPFDHYKRWNIDYDSSESFKRFKYRMSNYLSEVTMDGGDADLYNFLIGAPIAVSEYGGEARLTQILSENLGLVEYTHRLQALFELYERLKKSSEPYKARWEHLIKAVKACLSYSSDIGFELHVGEFAATLYPKGAKLLDEEVVNRPLLWLEAHPQVLGHFEVALKLYQENDVAKQRSLRNELRNSVEQLLKEILSNQKPIEKQGSDLKAWLSEKGTHPQVMNLYTQLLFGPYSAYQNDIKHTREFVEQDVEFMIYLTGVFMRQLLRLENQK